MEQGKGRKSAGTLNPRRELRASLISATSSEEGVLFLVNWSEQGVLSPIICPRSFK